MPDRQLALTDERLKTPRAAALAGILFAGLFSSSIVLIRLSVPPDVADHGAWLRDRAGSVALALNLVPFALALGLLLSIGSSLWVVLIFPAWVCAVSCYFLVSNLRSGADAERSAGGAS